VSARSITRAASAAGIGVPLVVGAFVHVVFPASVHVAARRAARPRPRLVGSGETVATVTVVIPARDEALHIADKVKNALHNGYPEGALEVLVVDDGSTDGTGDIAAAVGARVLRVTDGRGKCNAINHGVAASDADVVVITDANGILGDGAITAIVNELSDPRVAVVSGIKRPAGDGAHGVGERIYWLLEGSVRHDLGRLGCVDSADGSIFGFRRAWFEPIPGDIINDDFYLAAKALADGHRVTHADGAHAEEHVSATPREELRRRVRISAGVWQTASRFVHLAHPRRGMVAYAFVGHRLLRSIVLPCLLPVLLVSSIARRRTLVGGVLLAGQTVVYGAGLAGAVTGASVLGAPFQYSMLNLASIRGGFRFLSGRQAVAWERLTRVAHDPLITRDDREAAA
jgi:cellulose synthase/poly-beta-1,6-N-acetylglucosamine synthase-like glycosyltransferase